MKSSKMRAATAILAVAAVGLAGCSSSKKSSGNSSSATGSSSSSASTGGSTTSSVAPPSVAATGNVPVDAKNPATAGQSITVLMVNNPQMEELKALTPTDFTAKTGITVKYDIRVEQDMRNTASTEFAAQSGKYDVATLSNFEIPFYAKAGWLDNMTSIAANKAFDQADILPSMSTALSSNGTIYGEPFYGESSFLMYRKDVFAAKHLTMPAKPTWAQVADLAAKADSGTMKGICLRGLAGWGDNLAPLTTIVNTMGGTWFDENWNAQVNTGGFKTAANFYVNLIKAHGEPGAASDSFPQCLAAMQTGKVAMWYDATSAAGALEAASSPVRGKMGYAPAPVTQTKNSGWLYTWAWAIEKASKHEAAADQFVAWASSKTYEQEVAADTTHKDTGGPSNIPAGKRTSTYSNATYLKVAKNFAVPTLASIKAAPSAMPGVQQRPYSGIQFVGIPSFTAFGTQCGQGLSSAIAGRESVDKFLNDCQALASPAGKKAKKAQK